jgi:hypothetical protein
MCLFALRSLFVRLISEGKALIVHLNSDKTALCYFVKNLVQLCDLNNSTI